MDRVDRLFDDYLEALDRCRDAEAVVRVFKRFMAMCADVIRDTGRLFRMGEIDEYSAADVYNRVESAMSHAEIDAVEKLGDILSGIGYRYRQEVDRIAYRSFLKPQ